MAMFKSQETARHSKYLMILMTLVLQHGFLLAAVHQTGAFQLEFFSVKFMQIAGPALAADPRPCGHQRFGKSDN